MKTFLTLGTLALPLALSLFLTGCSSALKRKCEETNWFQYGESVAKSGQRTASDTFVLQCEKEEALIDHAGLSSGFQKGLSEYCTADFAYQLGREGKFLVGSMCSSAAEREMKPRHAAGVLEYCQPGNGEATGATGAKYNKICPKELETAFLPEFNKGRKKFLTATVAQREGEIQDLDREIQDLDRRRVLKFHEAQTLQANKTLSRTTTYDPKTGATVEQISAETSKRIDDEIKSVQYDISQIDRQIESKRSEQKRLRQELREAQTEMLTM